MSFPLFNLQLLKAINRKIKLKSFNEKSLARLKILNEHRQKISLFHLGLSGDDNVGWRKRFVKAIHNLNSKKFQEHIQQYRDDCQHYKFHQDALALQAYLQPSVWQEWLLSNKKQEVQLEKLKKFWSLNQETNHYTSAAIEALARHVLPIYEDFYQLALSEIKYYKSRFPEKLYTQIRYYLKSCHDYLRHEKTMLCDAMLSRLKVSAEFNDIHFDDTHYYTIDKITQLGIKVNCAVNPPRRRELSRDLFLSFHQYIHLNGNSAQKYQLRKLAWFVDDRQFYQHIIDDRLVIIPREMKKFEPASNPSFFDRMLPWRRYFAQFFKDKFYDITNIRFLYREKFINKMTLADMLKGEKWLELSELEKFLVKEHNQAQIFSLSFLSSLFRPAMKYFYQAWDECLKMALLKIVDHKLNYIEMLAEQLRTRVMFNLDPDVFSDKTMHFLEEIIASIEVSIIAVAQNHDYRSRWTKQKDFFSSLLNKKIKSPETSRNSSNLIIGYLSNEQNQQKSNYLSNNEINYSGSLEEIKTIYNTMLKNDLFDVALISDRIAIKRLQVLCKLCEKEIRSDLDFWKQFFMAYLKTCLSRSTSETVLNELIELLKLYGPEYMKSSIENLMVFSSDNIFIYHVKCKALLFGLQDCAVNQDESLDVHLNHESARPISHAVLTI